VACTSRRRIPNTPAAPAAARRYVGEVLAGERDEVVDLVALMVSELATNCVLYADSDLTVSVEKKGRQLRVDVADDGAGTVTLRNPGSTELTGRGLRIVEQLSDKWGVCTRRGRDGKSVWFTVRS
jgi:anti-sigma regulatory factor (Ser/Thr protein kinase)